MYIYTNNSQISHITKFHLVPVTDTEQFIIYWTPAYILIIK